MIHITDASITELTNYSKEFKDFLNDPDTIDTSKRDNIAPLVILINGVGRCGKDTFIDYLNELMDGEVASYSVIDQARKIAHIIGSMHDDYNNISINNQSSFSYNEANKTDPYRQLLYDIKTAWEKFNNGPALNAFNIFSSWFITNYYVYHTCSNCSVFIINTRETSTTNTLSLLLKSSGVPVLKMLLRNSTISSADYVNSCDSNVDNIPDTYYDIIIETDNKLNQLKDAANMLSDKIRAYQNLYGFPISSSLL